VFAGHEGGGGDKTPANPVLRRIAREGLTVAANCVLFLAALVVAFRIVYPLVFSVLKLGRVEPGFHAGLTTYQAMVLSISTAFGASGIVSRLWTRHVLNVVAVSASLFIVGMIMLGQAMYLADGGDPSIMWTYIRPRVPEFLGAVWCAGAAMLGWYIGGILWRRHRGVPGHDSA
jgi:hypothetical protein